jgi:hypothetical protein
MWEYKVVETDRNEPLDTSDMNFFGKSGWELVGTQPTHAYLVYYFKRPASDARRSVYS